MSLIVRVCSHSVNPMIKSKFKLSVLWFAWVNYDCYRDTEVNEKAKQISSIKVCDDSSKRGRIRLKAYQIRRIRFEENYKICFVFGFWFRTGFIQMIWWKPKNFHSQSLKVKSILNIFILFKLKLTYSWIVFVNHFLFRPNKKKSEVNKKK